MSNDAKWHCFEEKIKKEEIEEEIAPPPSFAESAEPGVPGAAQGGKEKFTAKDFMYLIAGLILISMCVYSIDLSLFEPESILSKLSGIWGSSNKGNYRAPAAAAIVSDADFMNLCRHGTPKEVENAIRNGADAREARTFPLATAASFNSNTEVVDILIKNGANVNARDQEFGLTALMGAAMLNANPKMIDTLIQNGAEVDIRDKSGNTALTYSIEFGNSDEVVSALIKGGADVNIRMDKGVTPLLMAAVSLNPNPKVYIALIQAGADVNAQFDEIGITALMLSAASPNSAEIAAVLIENGADENMRDRNGWTAMDYLEHKDEWSEVLQKLNRSRNELMKK